MSCSSAIYIVNAMKTNLLEDSLIPFGSTRRRFGRFLAREGEGVKLIDRGYYNIQSSLTVEPADNGPVRIIFKLDGEPIPGATATASGEGGHPVNLSVLSLIRLCERDSEKTLTAHLLDAGTVTNMSTVVMKV